MRLETFHRNGPRAVSYHRAAQQNGRRPTARIRWRRPSQCESACSHGWTRAGNCPSQPATRLQACSPLAGSPDFRKQKPIDALVAFLFDDCLLLRMGNWQNFKFLPLLNDRLVALTIPIPFDDRGIFGFYGGRHRRRDQRCCYASEDKLAHRSVSNELRLIQNLEELQMFHLQTLDRIFVLAEGNQMHERQEPLSQLRVFERA
jgi:hypothetical protein